MARYEPPRGDVAARGTRDVAGGSAWATLSSVDNREPAAVRTREGAAAGCRPTHPWPEWAVADLETAVAVFRSAAADASPAAQLYREWYCPRIADVTPPRPTRRPLAGLYRAAHGGSRTRHVRDGVQVVDRHDVVGADGWWRTWGEAWTPPRTRPGSLRLLFTPHPDRITGFVEATTRALLPVQAPWSLACATNPRRVRRFGAAVLDVRSLDDLPVDLPDVLAPYLHPVRPPLSLPFATGVGVVGYPDNGMTFGEHRCHLVALALRHPSSTDVPLRAIAAVFAAHGIDPGAPHRNRIGR